MRFTFKSDRGREMSSFAYLAAAMPHVSPLVTWQSSVSIVCNPSALHGEVQNSSLNEFADSSNIRFCRYDLPYRIVSSPIMPNERVVPNSPLV